MDKNQKREELLLKIMHGIAQKYKGDCLLKGGMLLRLYNSPRYTQDIDYVFRARTSRKVIETDLKNILEKEPGVEISNVRLNSRGIFLDVQQDDVLAQIEISVVKDFQVSPEQMTTASLAIPLKMSPRIISILPLSVAFAHKIAASLERKNLRDLYDLSLFEPQSEFDQETLKERLENLRVDRQKPIRISFQEAALRLKKRVDSLREQDFREELFGFLPPHFFKDIDKIVRSSALRICQRLEAVQH